MRKTFREILQTPANALQAMVDGLREQSKRPDFLVDMSTYGETSSDDAICYGCAATCTVQKATGKDLRQLFEYFGMTHLYRESYNNRWFLGYLNWEAQLPAVESFITDLKGQS